MKKTDLYELSFEMKNQLNRRIFSIISFCVLLCSVVTLILQFLIFPVKQRSVSMEPTFSAGSCIMVNHLKKKNVRGEIVLVSSRHDRDFSIFTKVVDKVCAFFTGQQYFPLTNLHRSGSSPVFRRIVGVPGDTIYMNDYVLYIKPEGQQYFLTEFEFIKKPYTVGISPAQALWDSQLGAVGSFEEIKLGQNEYFLLSDNRTSAADSRLWGPVDGSKIIGKAVFKYFPLKEFKFF